MSLNQSISVVIINYQGQHWLPRCLASIDRLQERPMDTIVIDNASHDGGIEVAAQQFPHVRMISNHRNLGFAKACNQAMRIAQGDYVAILNNDLELDPRWLTAMRGAMEQHPSAAATASKLRLMAPRHALAGAGACMNWQGFGFDRGAYELDTGQYDQAEPVLAACAAAILIRRSAFETIGSFDGRFFMYHEDVDWCWRAWLHGFEVWYVPEAIAYHKVEGSTKRYLGASAKERLGQRNRIRSLLKCYEGKTLRQFAFSSELWHWYGKPSLRNWLRLAWPVAWNLWFLPSTLAQRRRIQRGRRRTDEELSHLILATDVPVPPPRQHQPAVLQPSQPSLRVSVVDVGVNDTAVLGSGWFWVEPAPGSPVRVRWTQQSASIQLWQAPGSTRLFLELFSYAQTSQTPLAGRVLVNGQPVGRFFEWRDRWFRVECILPMTPLEGRWITVMLELLHTWQPVKIFGNADHRRMGVALRRAGCVAPPACFPTPVSDKPPISVVIPTHNRAPILAHTLSALLEQTYPASQVEIIVVDDGSTDDTADRVRTIQAQALGRLRYLQQPACGAAAARNYGLRAARAELILLLDDDIVPELDLIAGHVAMHRRLKWSRDVAVVGYSRWPLERRPSVFLDYIGLDGPQFAYRSMVEGLPLSCYCFYSSNLSLYKQTCGVLVAFDELFPNVWDDVELGYRLVQRGLRLYFHPQAIGYHSHVRSFREFTVRQVMAGRYAVALASRYPELSEWLKVLPQPPASLSQRFRVFMGWLTRASIHRSHSVMLTSWYRYWLGCAYQRGVREGWQHLQSHPPQIPSTAPDLTAAWQSLAFEGMSARPDSPEDAVFLKGVGKKVGGAEEVRS